MIPKIKKAKDIDDAALIVKRLYDKLYALKELNPAITYFELTISISSEEATPLIYINTIDDSKTVITKSSRD